MPTITAFDLNTLLKLAHASYCEKEVDGTITADNTITGAQNALEKDFGVNSGFAVIDFKTYDDGTQIVAYQNGNNIIIAYRGTEEFLDYITDVNILIEQLPQGAYSIAEQFYLDISTDERYQNMNIELVGHSLGGALAQLVAAKYNLKAGRLGFNPTTRMKYNKIKQNTDIINIKSVA